MENLIIVESPAKAKTIKNFLDKSYTVIASKGHLRDLPKTTIGVKIDGDQFTPTYQVTDDHKAVAAEIKKLSEGAKNIFLATDEDREGEAIAFHIASVVGQDAQTMPRIVFHEITKNAITEALKNPKTLDMDKVNAQQARRILDRLVGYKLSPLLSSKIQKGLSAGRVQSAALKIVIDREREIRAFIPIEHYLIDGIFEPNTQAELSQYKGKKIDKLTVRTKKEADEIVETAKNESFTVQSIETKPKTTTSPPPFMTSTLQQAASSSLGYSPKKTMQLAQKLYEGVPTDNGISGVITYMRTDSLTIAKEAQEAALALIEQQYGKDFVPKTPKVYKTKNSSAQEAHEAIRPSDLAFTPQKAKALLKSDEARLYTLIYNRFLASQMTDAKFETQTILFASPSCVFKVTGRKLLFEGFYAVLGAEDKDKLLPSYTQGAAVKLSKVDATQKFTEPPSRYSEASLVKALEAEGIGRPSTYAPTISTLEARNYIVVEKKQIMPTEMAFKVIEMLEKHFEEIVDSGFTSRMEEKLDEVAQAKVEWQKLLADFYHPFAKKIDEGKKAIESQKVMIPIDEPCPECGEMLVRRSGRFGEFVSCSTYPKCKYTRNLGDTQPKEQKLTDIACDKCGSMMVVKSGARGEFLACSSYPKCKSTKPLTAPKELEVPCPECGGKIVEKRSKRGVFYGCANYPKCTFISNLPPCEKKCPECGYAMVHKKLKTKELYECLRKECKHKEPVA